MIRNGFLVTAAACAALVSALPSATAASDDWQRVGTGITGGVSGLALVEGAPAGRGRADAVVVRDNKAEDQSRVASVSLRPGRAPVVRELAWHGALPRDLEAVDAVPGRPGHYVALASRGEAYHFVVAGGRATVRRGPVALPGRHEGDNYEALALHLGRSGRTYAVWATRGSGPQKAVVSAARVRIGADGLEFGTVTARQEFSVPFPDRDEVRHISDLKVRADGTVLVSAASDPNVDDGPFASAVYEAGRFRVNHANDAVLRLDPERSLVPLVRFTRRDNRKIEAVAALPRGLGLWGTDDENSGGSLRFDRIGR
ncbi:hypothetical protein [Streptomyces sp. NPDC001515]